MLFYYAKPTKVSTEYLPPAGMTLAVNIRSLYTDERMNEKINLLAGFYHQHNRLPSYAEMATLFGFRSKSAVAKVVSRLLDLGVLTKTDGKLAPGTLKHTVRILGTVAAGFPTPAEEELADTMTLDEWLIEKREATYMLTVSGDSMKDAGIVEGDVVLVEKTSSPKLGQIVIAEIDGDWTMKYLRQKHGLYYLEAANEAYPDLHPEGELQIAAVVKAVIRKY